LRVRGALVHVVGLTAVVGGVLHVCLVLCLDATHAVDGFGERGVAWGKEEANLDEVRNSKKEKNPVIAQHARFIVGFLSAVLWSRYGSRGERCQARPGVRISTSILHSKKTSEAWGDASKRETEAL
jgi:hypothetical protein